MPQSQSLQNQHLLWRAAFGPMVENVATLGSLQTNSLWKLLKQTSAEAPVKIVVAEKMAEAAYRGEMNGSMTEAEKDKLKRQLRKNSRQEIAQLNVLWLDEMVNSKAQLREKMAFFWHGHFACKTLSSYFAQDLLHILRTNALGNFGTMLKAVSKSPAMLQFLNNQQNRKGHPNENFAREVMELFTMGRGNYTEQDIKEAARAFTGWGFGLNGEFVFKEAQHDKGEKTFLGKTGNFSGEDILDILLQQTETSQFITRKLYKYFISENINEKRVEQLANTFKKSGYDISALLEEIYTSSWFYESKNIGSKIKSPVELLVGIRRYLPAEFENAAGQLLFQKILGQILFYPPNVAGWPGGTTWIDSSTLMVRMQMPQVLAAKENITVKPKSDDDVNMGMMEEKLQTIGAKQKAKQYGTNTELNWEPLLKNFEKISRPDLLSVINAQLWQVPNRVNEKLLTPYLDSSSREAYIKSAVISLMSTPEYQMC